MSLSVPESAAPTRTDPVAAAASQVVGGPLGKYAALAQHTARSGWQPAATVLVGLSSLTVAAGVLQKSHCLATGWSNPDQFWRACYSDLPAAFQGTGLGEAMPYLRGATPLDQPLISGVVMWLVGVLVPAGSALARQQWYFALWAVLVTVLVMALVAVTAASVPRAPWRAAHVAFSPVLVLAGLVSVDLLGILLASVALWAWGRGRILLAGLVFGLAVSARTYPVVLLLAIGLLAVRSGKVRAWGRLAGMALVTVVAVSLPWFVINADGLLSVYRSWWRAPAGYGSLWMLSLETTGGHLVVPPLLGRNLPFGTVTALAILGWVAAVLVGAFFALTLDRRPTVAEVSLVMLVIVVVTGKTMPVQAGLWLLPLIALCGVKWRDHLVWAGFEATYFVAVWLYIAGLTKPDRGLPSGWYAGLLLLRVAAWLFLLVQVWRVAWCRGPDTPPEKVDGEPVDEDAGVATSTVPPARPTNHEQVTANQVDEELDAELDAELDEVDPLAGPMAGAPDRVLVRFV